MTKTAALQAWFEQFLPAYAAASVPKDVVLPYLTYEVSVGAIDSGEIGLTVNLWYYSEGNEARPNAKAQEISNAIGYGGTVIPCDGGYIWLKRGSPFCQSVVDESDLNIKRRYINVTVEYLTAN